jgi:hypothetical protein
MHVQLILLSGRVRFRLTGGSVDSLPVPFGELPLIYRSSERRAWQNASCEPA